MHFTIFLTDSHEVYRPAAIVSTDERFLVWKVSKRT